MYNGYGIRLKALNNGVEAVH